MSGSAAARSFSRRSRTAAAASSDTAANGARTMSDTSDSTTARFASVVRGCGRTRIRAASPILPIVSSDGPPAIQGPARGRRPHGRRGTASPSGWTHPPADCDLDDARPRPAPVGPTRSRGRSRGPRPPRPALPRIPVPGRSHSAGPTTGIHRRTRSEHLCRATAVETSSGEPQHRGMVASPAG